MLARPAHRRVVRSGRPVPAQHVASRRDRRRRGAPGRDARSGATSGQHRAVAHRGRGAERPRRCSSGPPTGAPIRPTSTSPACGARRTPTWPRSSRWRPTWSSPTRRRTAATTSTPSAPRACRCTSPTSAPSTALSTARSARSPACSPPAGSPVRRGSTRPSARGPPSPSPRCAAGPSCRSGDGRGWPSDATRSPAQCWPGSASTTRCATISNAIRASTRRRCLPHDLVVLPDEPYNFTAEDGPESFPGTQSVLVSGRLLTWYGPSLAEAARVLPALLQED